MAASQRAGRHRHRQYKRTFTHNENFELELTPTAPLAANEMRLRKAQLVRTFLPPGFRAVQDEVLALGKNVAEILNEWGDPRARAHQRRNRWDALRTARGLLRAADVSEHCCNDVAVNGNLPLLTFSVSGSLV